MTWFKVDDSFHAHPKVLATEPDALGLWVVAGAWSSAHLTDGFVPTHALSRLLPGSDDLARKLVTAGLWRRAKGGYQFHDWCNYQPTADDVRTMREKRANAGRIGGVASGKVRSKPASKSEALASPTVEPPTRPDPLKNNTSSSTATPSTDKDFDRFWAAYPRRIGKGQARKAWAKALKAGTDPETVIEAAGRFTALRGNEDPKFTPHPSTWLNGERWTDVPDPEPPREAGPVMPWDLWG
jgi:hypothetical protein